MKTISTRELAEALVRQPDLLLLDVRTPVEFDEVHVPQARNVPMDGLQAAAFDSQKDQPVYLFCRTDRRETMAAEKFLKEGFAQPIVVTGGTLGWVAENLRSRAGE